MKHAYNLDEAKGHHVHSKEKGYEAKEYEHQEYPKYLGDKLVKNAEEEAAYYDSQADGEK